MVEVVDAAMTVAPVQQEGNQGCAYVMAVVRDVRWRIAPKVQKASQVSVSLMVVAEDVSFQHVLKVLKEAPCSVRHMVAAIGARLKVAPRVQKVVRPSAKVTVVVNDAHMKVVVFVQRASMVEPYSVWHMVVVKDVQSPVVHEVQGDAPTVVFVMVVVRDANLKNAGKALKVVLTSARPMVVERDARGASPVQSSVSMIIFVMHSQGASPGYVRLMVLLFRIKGSMVVPLWELWFMKHHQPNLKN